MATLARVGWKVFVVKVANKLLRLESKLLIENHGRVIDRHVQCNVLIGAGLEKRVRGHH